MTGQEWAADEPFYPYLYRGIVKSTPDGLGKIQVTIPQVHGESVIEAMPCQPPGVTAAPQIDKGVWVMFEAGDPAQPVWLGVWGWS